MNAGIFAQIVADAPPPPLLVCQNCKWCKRDPYGFDNCESPAVIVHNEQLIERALRSGFDAFSVGPLRVSFCKVERRQFSTPGVTSCGPHARFFEPRPLSWLERLWQRLRRVPV